MISGTDVKKLFGQTLRVPNVATGKIESVAITSKNLRDEVRSGLEAYGLQALHTHSKRGAIEAFLKVFKFDIPERAERSRFLVNIGLGRSHEWLFQGVPYAWLDRMQVNGVEIVGHLTRFIGKEFGQPAEDFSVLRQSEDGRPSRWDAYNAATRRSLASHLASAVCALERMGLVHGDLSPGNIMIGNGPKGKVVCCLCDFDGFEHAQQPRLPRKFEGFDTRPLGSSGYRYPELMQAVERDTNGTDSSLHVATDRFALGSLICELMTWTSKTSAGLDRGSLIDEAALKRGDLGIPAEAAKQFPEGFALLEKAAKAGSLDDMPSPEDWLKCLGIATVAPLPFKGVPRVAFYQARPVRRLFTQAMLKSPAGTFQGIDQELSQISYQKEQDNHLALKIAMPAPGLLRRSGGTCRIEDAEKNALQIFPGDVLSISNWELAFEDSASA